jgi:flagellar hook assembly protein FlgD
LTPTQTHISTATATITVTITITTTPTPYSGNDIIVYPNPFSPNRAVGGVLKIAHLPIGADISIYTISGELVTSLSAQTSVIYWNGRNGYGSPVSPGIYYYRVESNSNNVLKTGTIFVTH